VVAVHALLAAIILSGLNVRMVTRAVEHLTTVNIIEPPPPPPPEPPPPAPKPQQMKKPAGAPAKKAKASPIVAPTPKLPVLSPVRAAKVAGTGSASSSGAGVAGNGTGAGGSGNGQGGGGSGDFSRFTPARLIQNLSRSDYRRLAAGRLPFGSADVALQVDRSGRVAACRLLRSSGDSVVDAGLCPLISSQLMFRPALNAEGQPVGYSTNFRARWSI
jgi:protein TonB